MGEVGRPLPRCTACGGNLFWDPADQVWRCLLCAREILEAHARGLAQIRRGQTVKLEDLKERAGV